MAERKVSDEIAPILAGNSNFVSGYETFEPEIPRSDSDSTEIHHPGEKSQIRIDVAQATQEESDFSAAFVNHDGDDDDDDDISEIEADILKKSLPSMQLRRVKSLARPGTLKQRKFSSRAGIHDVSSSHNTSFQSQFDDGGFLTQLEGLDQEDAVRFRETAVPLRAKKSVRRTLKAADSKTIGRWKQFKLGLSVQWDHFKIGFVNFFKNIDIWKSNLKAVEGKFGSGVLSYFTFLRWLFLLDLFIALLAVGFLLVPQLLYSPSYKGNLTSFTGKELLSGEGWFRDTEMYYGAYSNATIEVISTMHYNIPFAYLCVAGGYILICLIILVRSMGISYKRTYLTGHDVKNAFFIKVFCSWDYAVTQKSSATIKSKSIYNDFMESISDSKKKRERTPNEICQLIFLRVAMNLITLAMVAAACYLIYYVSNEAVKDLKADRLTKGMLPAVTISTLNLLLPFAFRITASMEQYSSPKHLLAVSLFRSILLKLSTLCIYVAVLYSEVKCITNVNNKACDKVPCWETWVGEQIYKLALIDFIYLLLATILGEYARRLFVDYIPKCDERFGYAGFDISRNVLDLIYAQGLCWIGAFFCPLLPLITVIKFFILFYLKKHSVLRNCRPTMRPFKATKMNLLFLFLLALMLALACVVIGYVIINEKSMKPSEICGPFRGKDSIYQVVKDVINNDLSWTMRKFINVAVSATVLAILFFILALLAYYYRLRKSSAEKKIKLLKEQIAMAGQDKLYLLREIRAILKTDRDT